MTQLRRRSMVPTLLLSLAAFGFDDPPTHPSPSDAGRVAAASPEPNEARAAIRLPAGVKVDLFAAEPLVANPVAFHIDEKGRFYVVETFRHTDAVTDNREHMYWLDADLASRTVEDRVAMYRKFLPNSFGQFAATEDRVRLILDKDGDGRADAATVFADGFANPADGIAAGVLARKGTVHLAGIPSLWLLRDTKGTGEADVRKELQTGYGVHVAFLGHDLHGLRYGPDGRLYFSIGDRGLNVKTSGGRSIVYPDAGAILRSEPDGTKLEIFATGLRNPQELAFDDFGDLFTVDNNSDSGDRARVVHLVEGGDSGWRIGYQYMEAPVTRGPWNSERLWYPRFPGQAAYILPPLMNLSDGPSGLTREPGVSALPDRYRGRFFLADFRGAHATSGIRSFGFKPAGASHTVVDAEEFVWSVLATDVEFGPDGALYVSDWVDGWRKTGKGRIWRFADPAKEKDARVAEVRRLLAEGMSGRSAGELGLRLAHADQRVRQEAQFELAERAADAEGDIDASKSAREVLSSVAFGTGPVIPRLHAIWGLGQFGRKGGDASALIPLLKETSSEVRAQAAKTLGDLAQSAPDSLAAGRDKALRRLIELLSDAEPRVRFFSAQAIGRFQDRSAVAPLFAMLTTNADADVYLRHAGAHALAEIGDVSEIAKAKSFESKAARLAAVVALRRLASPEVAEFLADGSSEVVAEAARSIYEAPIDAALPKLAARGLTPTLKQDEAFVLRSIAANERVGGADGANRLVAIGRDAGIAESMRILAFEALANWAVGSNRDRVNGLYRPAPPRPTSLAQGAAAALASEFERLRPATVRAAAVAALGGLDAKSAGEKLRKTAADPSEIGSVRVAAYRTLDRLGDPGLSAVVTAGVDDRDARIRAESHRLLAKLEPTTAVGTLAKVWAAGSIPERQNAASILGGMNQSEADAILVGALDDLVRGTLAPQLELDVREAAAKRAENPAVRERLGRLAPPTGDSVAAYLACLHGGDADRGGRIFRQSTTVECLRCHKLQTKGGEVGPELTTLGAKRDRRYILEAIVAPNKAIAEGFESVVIAKADGTIIAGVLRGEDEGHVRLVTTDGKLLAVPKAEIEERRRGPSAMPEDIAAKLSKAEIRDLVEFLSRQK